MKSKKFKTEEELAAHVVSWLEEDEWDVYQEVPLRQAGACADIVAVRGKLVWIVECKNSFGLSVIEQAFYWGGSAHFCSVAVPYIKDKRFAEGVSAHHGIGVLTLKIEDAILGYRDSFVSVTETVRPAFHRKAFVQYTLDKLKPEHKTAAKAGTAKGGRFTPYRATCEHVLRAVQKTPGIEMKALLTQVQHHYASNASARATLAARIEENLVPGVRLEREGRIIRLYPR
jgi:hypothetical protein